MNLASKRHPPAYRRARSILLRRAMRLWERGEADDITEAFERLCKRYGVQA